MADDLTAAPPRIVDRFAKASTGAKILAVLTLALAPLGIIALLVSLQTSRTADVRHRAELRIAAQESARKLGGQLASDLNVLGGAINGMEAGQDAAFACGRAHAVLAARTGRRASFALFGAGSTPICATHGFRPTRPPMAMLDPHPAVRIEGNALLAMIPSRSGGSVAVVRYASGLIADIARPRGYVERYALLLDTGASALPLVEPGLRPIADESVEAPTGVLDIQLRMTAARLPFSAADMLLTFLPLLMWAAAAVIGFVIVDRLLIRPLERLRGAVAAHQPGSAFSFDQGRSPSREIRDLAETFARTGEEIAGHEARLAEALAHQTKLTREVHHRVKNNLQVVASLISLHMRGAQSDPVRAAYASIQRRVDALAIVHRNHYAELDAHRGVALKPLLGELSANLRATAPDVAPTISIAVAPVNVGQDAAVAIAFLVTELSELSMAIDPAAGIAVAVAGNGPGRARLTLGSAALRAGEAADARLAGRYARIIEGLARQLRSPLARDEATGEYSVGFATVD